jgi:formylmethanofuran dehydrogenase subunit E
MEAIDLKNPRREIERAVEANDLAGLLRISGLLHGHFCPGSAMGVKAATRAVRELKARSTGMEETIAIVETNSCFSDGVQMVTGCSFGNNALIYQDYGKTAVTLSRRSGDAVRIALKAGGPSPLERFPGAAGLFKKVIQERRGTEDEEAELKKLWIDIAFKMMDVPDEEIFSIAKVQIELPAYARIFASVKCSVCGENIMEPRARVKDGKPICLSCSGQPYYQLTGNGMSLVNK